MIEKEYSTVEVTFDVELNWFRVAAREGRAREGGT
jgi:hypothetical protein